jgi:periplasmic protein TonB
VERFDQRQGFLISALVHSAIVMVLASRPDLLARKAPVSTPAAPEVSRRVFMPPPEVLRQLAPRPVPPPAAARPAPTPPPPERGKDRISIGAPSPFRQKEPLVLRRDDDLTKVAKGLPNAQPLSLPTAPPATAAEPARASTPEVPGAPGLRRPPGATEAPRGEEGLLGRAGTPQPSITASLRNLEQRLQSAPQGAIGLASGTGQQMGPFFFDPQGADFTAWTQHLKNEVYRNWIVPQPALMGFRGHVDLEFTVARDGAVSGVRLLKSSGTTSLDRAAQNALLGSRLLRLPSDYAPDSLTIQVTFFYNEDPGRS